MAYNSFGAIFWTHFFVGVVIGTGLWLFAHYCQAPRMFQFGGPALSLGLPHRWLAWILVCLTFEFISSCRSPAFYQEMALSIVETPAMVLGAFVVDRMARWQEFEQQFASIPDPIAKVRAAFSSKPKPSEPPDKTAEKFDDITRNK